MQKAILANIFHEKKQKTSFLVVKLVSFYNGINKPEQDYQCYLLKYSTVADGGKSLEFNAYIKIRFLSL